MNKNKIDVKKIFTYIFLVILCLIILYPLFFIYNNAFKKEIEFSDSFIKLTKGFNFEGFKHIWVTRQAYNNLLNTLITLLGSLILSISLAISVSFRISRYKIMGGNTIYIFFTMGIILSHVTCVLPIFVILKALHLINNYFGLILAFTAWNLSISILFLTAFFRSIPKELQDAATIDGCSDLGFLLKVLIPLSKAPISIVILLNTLFIWNDLIFPQVLTSDPKMKLVSVTLIYFRSEYSAEYNILFSAIAFMILPLIVLYISFQRFFVIGTFSGAMIE